MESTLAVAGFLYRRYIKEHNLNDGGMSEMKLHKLMYFVQRESFIQNNEPLFDGLFHAWKYGPVLKELRDIYIYDNFHLLKDAKLEHPESKEIISAVYDTYSHKDAWSLSSLTHLEYSWTNARKGLPDDASCDAIISNNDIKIDADRVKKRRLFALL